MSRFLIGFVLCTSFVLAGSSLAAASSKFAYTEELQFPGGSLVVAFEEAGQKKYDSVDYRLDATVVVTSCQDPDHCVASISDVSSSVADLVPEAKGGRVAGSVALTPGSGGGCGCLSIHLDYTNVTLTNVTSGRVYVLDPISGDAP